MSSRLIQEGLKYLTEIFKRPYPFHKVQIDIGKSSGMAEFHAYTQDRKLIKIDFTSRSTPNVYDLEFTVDYEYGKTGLGDQFRILSTVLKALEIILDKHKDDIRGIEFVVDKDYDLWPNDGNPYFTVNLSRARLYERIINRFARREGFSSRKEDYDSGIEYFLTNKDFSK